MMSAKIGSANIMCLLKIKVNYDESIKNIRSLELEVEELHLNFDANANGL